MRPLRTLHDPAAARVRYAAGSWREETLYGLLTRLSGGDATRRREFREAQRPFLAARELDQVGSSSDRNPTRLVARRGGAMSSSSAAAGRRRA
jgi:hypothetical protein